mmetsp:Transcript_107880/g.302098  ORF Transcript_107880/g.302098 Transcript_107880/m.302098 type:complete len:207 (-) Transcript_107880:646-1266(-)
MGYRLLYTARTSSTVPACRVVHPSMLKSASKSAPASWSSLATEKTSPQLSLYSVCIVDLALASIVIGDAASTSATLPMVLCALSVCSNECSGWRFLPPVKKVAASRTLWRKDSLLFLISFMLFWMFLETTLTPVSSKMSNLRMSAQSTPNSQGSFTRSSFPSQWLLSRTFFRSDHVLFLWSTRNNFSQTPTKAGCINDVPRMLSRA